MRWVVGTDHGLVGSDGRSWLVDRDVTAVAADGAGWLVLLDGREVARVRGDEVLTVGILTEETGRCILPLDEGAVVGTSRARLAFVGEDAARIVTAFDEVEGRDGWYTPWGGPPDTRSLSASPEGSIFANVHVGGIPRAPDLQGPWTPTIDVDADVHQVLVDPLDAAHVVAATALGLAESRDRGDTWTFLTDGLHASYARAVALDGDRLYVSASTGPRGGRAAVYRREPAEEAFQRCDGSLPDWFAGNVDSHCLAAGGGAAIFGTEDGRVFLSEDEGRSWREVLGGSARVRAVALGPAGAPRRP